MILCIFITFSSLFCESHWRVGSGSRAASWTTLMPSITHIDRAGVGLYLAFTFYIFFQSKSEQILIFDLSYLQDSAKLEKAEILQMTVDHLKTLHSKG